MSASDDDPFTDRAARPDTDAGQEEQVLFDRFAAGDPLPEGYQPYGYAAADDRRGKLVFTLAVLSGVRAVLAVLSIALAFQLEVAVSTDTWAVDGMGTLVATALLFTVAAVTYTRDEPAAPALSLCADAIQLFVTVKAFADAGAFEGRELFFLQTVVTPVVSVAMAIKVLRITNALNRRQSGSV